MSISFISIHLESKQIDERKIDLTATLKHAPLTRAKFLVIFFLGCRLKFWSATGFKHSPFSKIITFAVIQGPKAKRSSNYDPYLDPDLGRFETGVEGKLQARGNQEKLLDIKLNQTFPSHRASRIIRNNSLPLPNSDPNRQISKKRFFR